MDVLNSLNSGHFHLIGSGSLASVLVWLVLRVVKPLMHKHREELKELTKAIHEQTKVLKAIAKLLETSEVRPKDVHERLSNLESYLRRKP